MSTTPKTRPFLKWPGGKFRILPFITSHLPENKVLVEPFAGSLSLFLNTNYEYYLLNDVNEDLISLYKLLKKEGKEFIQYAKSLFTIENNTELNYYKIRKQFNTTKDRIEKAGLFLYLNRHGYNGLCRYNKKKQEYNVPYGRYKKPYFPEYEMYAFLEKAERAEFKSQDYREFLKKIPKNSTVYCDPPYVPLSKSSNFTQYSKNSFSSEDQKELAAIALYLQRQKIPVVISNHNVSFTRNLYKEASIKKIKVQRYISCKATHRKAVSELLAIYK